MCNLTLRCQCRVNEIALASNVNHALCGSYTHNSWVQSPTTSSIRLSVAYYSLQMFTQSLACPVLCGIYYTVVLLFVNIVDVIAYSLVLYLQFCSTIKKSSSVWYLLFRLSIVIIMLLFNDRFRRDCGFFFKEEPSDLTAILERLIQCQTAITHLEKKVDPFHKLSSFKHYKIAYGQLDSFIISHIGFLCC